MILRKLRVIILLVAALLTFGAFLFAVQYQEKRVYPWLKVSAPDGLEIDFLLNRQRDGAQCAALLSNMASATQSTCSACKVVSHGCLESLDSTQEKYFSSSPLAVPIAHIRNGVVAFSSANPHVAMSACQESEKQAGAGQVACYYPGVDRPIPVSIDQDAHSFLLALASPVLWAAVLLLGLAFGYMSLIDQTARLSASLISLPRRMKQLLIVVVDVLSIDFSLWAAFILRSDSTQVPPEQIFPLLVVAPVLAFPVFVRQGLYRSVIRYLGLHALLAIVKSVVIYSVLLAVAIYMLGLPGIPRSVVIVHGALAMLLVAASRTAARYWLRSSQTKMQKDLPRKTVVIYGAGSAGIQLATALTHSREFCPVAFLDDDQALHRQHLGALEVFSPRELAGLIDRFDVEEVLLAIPSASRARRNEIIALLEPLPVHVRTLPGLTDLAQGKLRIEDLREVEIDDLLGRDPVAPDPRLLSANTTGKVVMVTGAGGSIGSELCRQIVGLEPKSLVLFELNEYALYRIEQELIARVKNLRRPVRCFPILGSVTDQNRLERVMAHFGVQTVFHAAAYKHVPMVEMNPTEGVYNNIFGTYRAAHAALATGVETFVLISTDKAVRPTNTMGTTKRFAEIILQALAEHYPGKTRFTMVRFGNVLGSSGSVVPLFREQIRRGGPVTVTDPRIIRYFMTIPEAAQLVIQAGAMGKDGDVFVLDMGEPVKILDLARRMIHLSGLSVRDEDNPDGDIEIVFSGLRPGEKLYEELLIGDNVIETTHPRIMCANEKMLPLATVDTLLEQFAIAYSEGDSEEIRRLLQDAVEEFVPQCGVEDPLLKSLPALGTV